MFIVVPTYTQINSVNSY